MNKITCDMCIDLMPLVQDGVASEDSRNAVLQHLPLNQTTYFAPSTSPYPVCQRNLSRCF